MYTFVFLSDTYERLKNLSEKYPSISNKMVALSINPNSIAIPTGVPRVNGYYVNCGIHAMIFDIDNTNSIVNVYRIVHRAYLDKLQKGRVTE